MEMQTTTNKNVDDYSWKKYHHPLMMMIMMFSCMCYIQSVRPGKRNWPTFPDDDNDELS